MKVCERLRESFNRMRGRDPHWVRPKKFYKNLPRKRAFSGVLIFKDDKMLVLETSYMRSYNIPGGVTEKGEAYAASAVRECMEELGATVTLKHLLCVDYNHGSKLTGDAVGFVFLGDIGDQNIAPDKGEVTAYKWLPVKEAIAGMEEPLAKRVAAAVEAMKAGQTIYCEDGIPVFSPVTPVHPSPPPPQIRP